ncbi:hypothetical protein KSX_23700 [Ktedonospora formicarum]|uniref:Uncharacterized protein n=1 Tax=Ktedonospora formicarum TaxID=2778364 RepID=A0A8J3HUF1_9CHLR|nr:hypothetical protein KSX_23700 [Ktedonospora formicarum]
MLLREVAFLKDIPSQSLAFMADFVLTVFYFFLPKSAHTTPLHFIVRFCSYPLEGAICMSLYALSR